MNRISFAIRSFVLVGLAMTVLANVHVNADGTRQRPFSEWLAAQGGTVSGINCGSTVFAWLTPDFATFARADYSGKIGECITSNGGPLFNSEFSGTVTERDLPDGTAEILVVHHFTNTHVVVRDNTQPGVPAPALLGFNAAELAGHPELTSAVGSGILQVRFIIPYPGAALPDLATVNVLSLSARFQGSGPLRAAFGVEEGTPGRALVNQTGLFNIPGQGNGVADSYPAELIRVYRAGQ